MLLDGELKAYTGPWPAFPGMYPVHLRDRGLLLEVAIWDEDVSLEELEADLLELDPDTEPMLLARVNFGTPAELAEIIASVMRLRVVTIDLTGTKEATRLAFGHALAKYDIALDPLEVNA